MILQPFIENSIMHGILPSEKKGKISILISTNDTDINFEIKDNGVGIEQSMNEKKKSATQHLSNGMKITKQRMALLKKISIQNYNVVGPMQLTDEKGNSKGTSVLISLPLKPKSKEIRAKKSDH